MLAAAQSAPTAESAVASGPYKFLDFYTDSPNDQRRFGGREREIRELVARIANEWTLVLYGRSGIGKTSLILAGIFPELQTRGYLPVYARTLTDPVADLCRAIDGASATTTAHDNVRAAAAYAAASRPLVIVLDQFEEFFIRFRERPEVRSAFIKAVAELVTDRVLDVTVVFSLREDYLAELDDFRYELPDLFTNEYRLHALTAFGVRQAISRPLIDSGIPYEEAVVSKLVDLLEDSEFDPAVLQIICSEVYWESARRATGPARITLEDVQRVGGLDAIFSRCLDGLAKAIPEEHALLARMILDALITGDDTKRALTLEDLLEAEFSATEAEARDLLELLVEQRLLRRQLRDGRPWYELIHERLVPHLKKWLESDPRFYEFRQARDFVLTNCKSEVWRRQPEALLNSGVLTDLLGAYKERFRFNRLEIEFILRSAIYRCSSDVTFWAQRFGANKAAELIEAVAASTNELERTGAAIAAGRVSDPDRRLAKLCLRLAMGDADSGVRRSAGLSLARLAKPPELVRLRYALGVKETRSAAREALTDLRLGGHPLREFSWLSRRFAKEKAEHRLEAKEKNAIRARTKVGALQGLLAGLWWGALVGVPLAAFATALWGVTEDNQWWLRTAAAVGCLMPLAGAIGALLGGAVASAIARDAAVTGEDGHWFRGISTSRPLAYTTLGLATLTAVLVVVSVGNSASTAALSGYLGSFLVLLLFVAVGLAAEVHWSRSIPGPAGSRAVSWAWSFLASLGCAGMTVAAPKLVLALTGAGELVDPYWLHAAGLMSWISFTVFVSMVAITSAEAKHPTHRPANAPPRQWWRRLSAFAGALLAIVWLAHSLEPDMLPLFAPREEQSVSGGLLHRDYLGPQLPDRRYFRLCNSGRSPDLVVINRIAGGTVLPAGWEPADERAILLFPRGCFLGSFTQGLDGRSRFHDLSLIPVPSRSLSALDPRWGSISETSLRLRRSSQGATVWRGRLEGSIDAFLARRAGFPGRRSAGQVREEDEGGSGQRYLRVAVSPQWYALTRDMPLRVRVRAFNSTSRSEDSRVWENSESSNEPESSLVVTSLPPSHPIQVNPAEQFWAVPTDAQGQWSVEFEVVGIPPDSTRSPEIEIPALVRAVVQEQNEYSPDGGSCNLSSTDLACLRSIESEFRSRLTYSSQIRAESQDRLQQVRGRIEELTHALGQPDSQR